MLDRVAKVFEQIISALGIVFLYGMVAAMTFEVVLRYMLPGVPVWTGGEPARFLLLWIVATGTPLCIYHGRNLSTEFLLSRFPQRISLVVRIMLSIISIIFLIIVLKLSYDFVLSNMKSWSIAMGLPLVFVNASLIFMFGTSLFYIILGLTKEVGAFVRRE